MKNILFKSLAILFLVVAITSPYRLSAQAKKVDKQQKKDYTIEKGHTMDKAYIDRILNKKMILLQHYLTVLIEKKEPDYVKTIDKAMALFNNNESRLITVTSKNGGKVYVKQVREYLTDVSKLPYKSVNITYRNYTAIEQIRKQPDGTFRGIAVFEQEFTGFDKEGKAMYSDVIARNVEVVIKIREYPKDETHHIVSVDIFFGNMGVTEM